MNEFYTGPEESVSAVHEIDEGMYFPLFKTVSANNRVTDGPEIKSIPCIVSRSFVAMCVDACLQGYLQGWG